MAMTLTTAFLMATGARANELWSTRNTKVSWRQKHYGKLAWQDVVRTCNSPEEVCDAVKRHVRYVADKADEWKTGKKTWQDGIGDCEDFAACVVDLCKEIGFEARVMVFYGKDAKEAHAVAIGRHEGQMWMSSNGEYVAVDSSRDARERIAAEQNWSPDNVASVKLADLNSKLTTSHTIASSSETRELSVGSQRRHDAESYVRSGFSLRIRFGVGAKSRRTDPRKARRGAGTRSRANRRP